MKVFHNLVFLIMITHFSMIHRKKGIKNSHCHRLSGRDQIVSSVKRCSKRLSRWRIKWIRYHRKRVINILADILRVSSRLRKVPYLNQKAISWTYLSPINLGRKIPKVKMNKSDSNRLIWSKYVNHSHHLQDRQYKKSMRMKITIMNCLIIKVHLLEVMMILINNKKSLIWDKKVTQFYNK